MLKKILFGIILTVAVKASIVDNSAIMWDEVINSFPVTL